MSRLIQHAKTTALYNVYYGEGRDTYDLRGRVVHESIFNTNDGNYRCPSTQQGYSPFSTWTRGLAWIITGYAEQLEFFATLQDTDLHKSDIDQFDSIDTIVEWMTRSALATADFYLDNSAADGVPYWDTGAPGLSQMIDNHLDQTADPYNPWEPVDSSAAVITAQGLVRLGCYLKSKDQSNHLATKYLQAGLTIADTLFSAPYLSESSDHQGLILHSVYHRPNGWDHISPGQSVPSGESSMWGDYHARELGLLLWRLIENKPYPTFF